MNANAAAVQAGHADGAAVTAGVEIEERSGALWATFNRPLQLNPLDRDVLAVLRATIQRAHAERPAALVLTGRGRAFSAGGDLRGYADMAENNLEELREVFREGAATLWGLEDLPVPVIAAVNGLCLAGGLEIVCFSDIVIAARGARFRDAHVGVGLMPFGGTVARLAARVGSAHAMRLVLTNAWIDAEEALRMGLVGEVVDDDQLLATVDRTCRSLAEHPASVLARLKALGQRSLEALAQARQQELASALENAGDPHVVEGLRRFLASSDAKRAGRDEQAT